MMSHDDFRFWQWSFRRWIIRLGGAARFLDQQRSRRDQRRVLVFHDLVRGSRGSSSAVGMPVTVRPGQMV
jgi:hypothetical protein